MVRASLLEMARTGNLGPLQQGMTHDELRGYLGPPLLWGPQTKAERARIWRYGDIEFHFHDFRVSMIFSDHQNLTDGGETMNVDPWVIHRGLPPGVLEDALRREGIRFAVARPRHDRSQRHVTTEARVVFGFVEESEDELDELGLAYWQAQTKGTSISSGRP